MRKLGRLLTWTFFASILIACSATSISESTGEYIDSAAVTAKVKTRLVDQLSTDGLGIKVKTYKGNVQLSGFVNSAIIKRHAGLIAAGTADVRHVRNDLIVK